MIDTATLEQALGRSVARVSRRAHGVVDDRHLRDLHYRRLGTRALRCRPEAGDRRQDAGKPQRAVRRRGDLDRGLARGVVQVQKRDVVATSGRPVVGVDEHLIDEVIDLETETRQCATQIRQSLSTDGPIQKAISKEVIPSRIWSK